MLHLGGMLVREKPSKGYPCGMLYTSWLLCAFFYLYLYECAWWRRVVGLSQPARPLTGRLSSTGQDCTDSVRQTADHWRLHEQPG